MKVKVGVLSLVGELIGVSVVFGVVVSITNVCEAGVGSGFPAASVAVTVNVCVPSLSVAVVNGDVQAAAVPVSTLQEKVERPSLEVNVNVGVLSLLGELIGVSVVSGAVVSTRTVRLVPLLVLPAASVAVAV